MQITSIKEFGQVARQRYAWPGGYPLYFIMDDGEPMCPTCALDNRRQLFAAWRDTETGFPDRGWRPCAIEINWEDCELTCCHCYESIECAYPEEQ